jgi:TolA-binding protein
MRSAGASPLEQRLLRAAGSELPSRALSERMARGIGVVLPAVGSGAAVGVASKTAAAASKAASSGGTLLPWVSGALVAAVVAGAFVAAGPHVTQSAPAPAGSAAALAPIASPTELPPAQSSAAARPTEAPSRSENAELPKPVVPSGSPRLRGGTTASELANQIALVDAARGALAGGDSARALASVRDYQSGYPNGSFKPEVAAIKIEALLKLGRKTEARALAERFSANYGAGPLADRVTRLLGAAQP